VSTLQEAKVAAARRNILTFLTLIVTKPDYQVTSIQFRDVLKVSQGYHNLNLTAKQPVITSPAVQFCPVPLKKRMLVRIGQVNRLISQ